MKGSNNMDKQDLIRKIVESDDRYKGREAFLSELSEMDLKGLLKIHRDNAHQEIQDSLATIF